MRPDGQGSERRHSQVGPDPVLKIYSPGARKRRCASNQWKRIWKGRRREKRVNRLCRMNPEAQKLTMTGIYPVQVHGHTVQGASTAQVDVMCRNLKMGTVGKTQACVESECRKLLPESSKSASGSRCDLDSMSTQGAEFVRSGGKLLPFGQRIPGRPSTVSPEIWKCKLGRKRMGTRSVWAWRKASSPISPRKQGLS